MKTLTKEPREIYYAPSLLIALDRIKKKIHRYDQDYVAIVDGSEGSGKSVYAMQICYYVDPTFCIERVCMNPQDFIKAIKEAQPHQAILYDEAHGGLSSRGSLSAINKLIVSKMMEMRQKNLFVIICMPSFFMLDRYVSLFRAKVLFHIFCRGTHHRWYGFNTKNKKMLYLEGRKMMSYSKPFIETFKGTFSGVYVVDEQLYRDKKRAALESDPSLNLDAVETPKQAKERDILIRILKKEKNLSDRALAIYLTEQGLPISNCWVSTIMRNVPLEANVSTVKRET